MFKFLLLVCVIGASIYWLPKLSPKDKVINVVAETYSVAVIYPENMSKMLDLYPGAFDEDGLVIDCFRNMADAFRAAALELPSDDLVRERAMEIATESGRPDLGPAIADGYYQSRVDLGLMGKYFDSLARTLPLMANGDDSAYKGSELYLSMTTMWRSVEGSGLLQDSVAFRNSMFDLNTWYTTALLQAK